MPCRGRKRMPAIEDVWYGTGVVPRIARAVLRPASWLYGVAVGVRGRRFEGASAQQTHATPAVSIGNLTVGGTGKTPIAAWAASRLRARHARPAIVMRGYGGDELLVHARLNPDVPVIVDANRVRGAERARAAGADCIILDDAFQHRRIARASDWVLVAAERWREDLDLLPAGPLREPLSALMRAQVLVVTRKSATRDAAEVVAGRLARRFPHLGIAMCHLALDALVNALTGAREPLSALGGRVVVGVAAVGSPRDFFAQLSMAGARIDEHPFRDHHAFTPAEVAALAHRASRNDGLVCTLKDAVKLAPMWPRAAGPLWYVSQIAVIERGETVLDDALETVLAARQSASSTAGSAGPSSSAHGHRSPIADR